MKGVLGVALSALSGAVSYFLSLGFVFPPGAEGFHFFATFGAISGFGVGSVFASRVGGFSLVRLGVLMAVNLLVGSSTALIYMMLVSTGAIAGHFVLFSILLSITFFCLGISLPLAGITFARSSDP
jgi:hypothetical protein